MIIYRYRYRDTACDVLVDIFAQQLLASSCGPCTGWWLAGRRTVCGQCLGSGPTYLAWSGAGHQDTTPGTPTLALCQ